MPVGVVGLGPLGRVAVVLEAGVVALVAVVTVGGAGAVGFLGVARGHLQVQAGLRGMHPSSSLAMHQPMASTHLRHPSQRNPAQLRHLRQQHRLQQRLLLHQCGEQAVEASRQWLTGSRWVQHYCQAKNVSDQFAWITRPNPHLGLHGFPIVQASMQPKPKPEPPKAPTPTAAPVPAPAPAPPSPSPAAQPAPSPAPAASSEAPKPTDQITAAPTSYQVSNAHGGPRGGRQGFGSGAWADLAPGMG